MCSIDITTSLNETLKSFAFKKTFSVVSPINRVFCLFFIFAFASNKKVNFVSIFLRFTQFFFSILEVKISCFISASNIFSESIFC